MKKRTLAKKTIIGFCLFALINTVVLVAIGGNAYRISIIDQYHELATQIAKSVSVLLSDDEVIRFAHLSREIYRGTASEEDKEKLFSDKDYRQLDNAMKTLQQQFGAADVCLFSIDREQLKAYDKDPENEKCPAFVIVDNFQDQTIFSGEPGDPMPFRPEVVEHTRKVLKSGKRLGKGLITKRRPGGYFLSIVYPVISENKSEAVGIGVVYYMETLITKMVSFVVFCLVASLLVSSLCMWLYLRRYLRDVISPIRLVSNEADSFVENELVAEADTEICVSEELKTVQTHDELQILAESILAMEEGIKRYVDDLTRVTAERERLGAELDLAAKIQSDMLPRTFPAFPEKTEFDLFASMDPAKEVGGDFYDFFLIDDDHLGLVMADVAGKGVPAALFMANAKTLIKGAAQQGRSPSKVLSAANHLLVEGNDAMLFVTVWMAVIEIRTGKGVAANAGHEDPILKRAGGSFERIEYDHDPAVAIMDGMPFSEHEFTLYPGDTLFVYTDGLDEAAAADGRQFGGERILSVLNAEPEAEPERLLHNMTDAVAEFVADAEQFDDLTMMAVSWRGTAS